MHLIVALVALLVAALAWSEARRLHGAYALKRNHLQSLYRLGDQALVSLPPLAGELLSAAIDEEIREVG